MPLLGAVTQNQFGVAGFCSSYYSIKPKTMLMRLWELILFSELFPWKGVLLVGHFFWGNTKSQ